MLCGDRGRCLLLNGHGMAVGTGTGTWTPAGGLRRPQAGPGCPEPARSRHLLFLVSYCLMFLMKWVFFSPLCLGEPDACLVLQVSKKLTPVLLGHSSPGLGRVPTSEPRHIPLHLPETRGSSAGT